MDNNHIQELFNRITVWKRGDQRAPHKPLLLLYAISRCMKNNEHHLQFAEIEEKIKQLLVEFGPNRKSYHPEYPFWRLKNDDIWELKNADKIGDVKKISDVKRSDLIKHNISGGFKKEVFDKLISNPKNTSLIVTQILEMNFPTSIHEDILQSIGLDLVPLEEEKRKRDPNFRDKILNAYEYQCAVCGFNVRVGASLVALEAAHIKWYQAGGPDSEENGIALCALHHKLFDRGAFTISNEMNIQVSDKANGTFGFKEWLLDFHNKRLISPQRPKYLPKTEFVDWHVREVFQGESRYHC